MGVPAVIVLALCQNICCMCVDSVCLIMASVLSPVTHTGLDYQTMFTYS